MLKLNLIILIQCLYLISISYSFQLIRTLNHDSLDIDKGVTQLCQIKEPSYLASGANDGSIYVWDQANGNLKSIFNRTNGGHSVGPIRSLVSFGNGLLASGSNSTIK